MADRSAIAAAIGSATQQSFQLISHDATGGGYIMQAEQVMQRLLADAG